MFSSSPHRCRAVGLATVVVAFLALALGPTASAQEVSDTGRVTIVHGLRGIAVDIYVDGEILLPAFEPDRLTDPLDLPVGDYFVELREADMPADSEPEFSATVTIAAGDNLAVVAHFDQARDWTVSIFDNNLQSMDAGLSRLAFRNTASTDDIEVLVGETVVAGALVSSEEGSLDLEPAQYAVRARLADGTDLVTAQDVTISEGAATVLYLVGDTAMGNFTWLMQVVEGLQTDPEGVPAGNSGLLDNDGAAGSTLLLAAATLALMGATALAPAARRRVVTSRREG